MAKYDPAPATAATSVGLPTRDGPRLSTDLLDPATAARGGACDSSPASRPWGSYRVLHASPGVQIKELTVVRGGQLSLQKHRHRAEHWIVVSGVAEVHLDGVERSLEKDESVFIPAGAVHRLANLREQTLRVIEIQTGTYFGEDDIVRLADIYDRA